MTRQQSQRLKRAFLESFRLCGNVTVASKVVGVERHTVYTWQEHDPAFVIAYQQAEIEATEVLEEEARRRAVDGVERPIYHAGKVVGHTREYSDVLLIFLLKARKPGTYREPRQGSAPPGLGVAPLALAADA